MAVTRLRAPSTTRTSPGVLTLDWQPAGRTPADAVHLSLEPVDGNDPLSGIQPLGPSRWLVQAVLAPLRLVARPAHDGVFPDETVLDIQLGLRHAGRDGGQLVLPPTDVSGTRESELLRFVPTDGVVEVVVPAPSGTGAQAPDGLPPLARSTVYAARRLAGHDGVMPAARRAEVHVAVDRSASMLPHVRSGARLSLLHVLLGLNEVVGTQPTLPVWQLGRTPSRLPVDLAAGTSEAVEEALGDHASTEGTAVAPLLATTSSTNAPRLVVVLTDGPPADVVEFGAQLQAPETSTRWHVLAFARSTSDPVVRQEPWRDELASLALLRSELFTSSAVSPGNERGWLETRLASPHELEQLLTDLEVWS